MALSIHLEPQLLQVVDLRLALRFPHLRALVLPFHHRRRVAAAAEATAAHEPTAATATVALLRQALLRLDSARAAAVVTSVVIAASAALGAEWLPRQVAEAELVLLEGGVDGAAQEGPGAPPDGYAEFQSPEMVAWILASSGSRPSTRSG